MFYCLFYIFIVLLCVFSIMIQKFGSEGFRWILKKNGFHLIKPCLDRRNVLSFFSLC